MSSNLLKYGTTYVRQDETRIINTNELLAKRMEEWTAQPQATGNTGFVSGIIAETIEVAPSLAENGDMEGNLSNVIKAVEEPMRTREEVEAEAQRILEEARAQAEQILAETQARAEQEKALVLEQAREQGLQEGMRKANEEAMRLEREFADKEKNLEEQYNRMMMELEPQFVETITGIYEHIFHVELQSYREILSHLIFTTMRKIEGCREFLIHVSKEDYPFVSMQKKQIASGAASAHSLVEIVEDLNLSKNQCLIETEGGIFDCGLGTQLEELGQKLRLLSYEK